MFDREDLSVGGAAARFVQDKLSSWKDVPASQVRVKDFSAAGGAKVYKVYHDTDALPAAVIMKAEGDTGDDDDADGEFNIQDDRSDAVAKVLEARDLAPKLLAHDPDGTWHIELFGGGGVSKDFNHFGPGIAPTSALAQLMADFHATPTDWYGQYRAKMVKQWPVLAEVPPYAPFWNGAAYGWENGALLTGGKMTPAKHAAQLKIFSLMVETGVYRQLVTCEAFYPTSPLAKRVVTIHGDFKPNNLINRSDKDGCMCIDYDFTHVSCVQQELSFAFSKWLGPKFQPYAYRKDFLTMYAKAAGLPNTAYDSDAALASAMLDIEIGTICNFGGLLFSGLSRQIPLLRGTVHRTPGGTDDDGTSSPPGPEIITTLAGFIGAVRNSPALSEEVVKHGIVVAMYQKAGGVPKGWLVEMRSHGSLGSFGIYADEGAHKRAQAVKAVITPWVAL